MGFSSSLAGQNKVGPNLRSTSPDGDSTLMPRAPCVARIRPHEGGCNISRQFYYGNPFQWYLYISGRKSDMIISGGENIFPLEVENVLRMNEKIAEVSVLGVPDEYWGESVQAAVVLRPDSKLTPEEIRTFCRGKIAGYKIPKKVYVWDELPKNTTGKVCKAEVLKKIKEEN